MVDTQVELRPPDTPVNVPRICHLVCCRDDDGRISLCGEDVTEEAWEEDGVECVMCGLAQRREFCPYYGRCLGDCA